MCCEGNISVIFPRGLSIFLDLTKAFDTVNHSTLLSKLSFYDFPNPDINWFKSHLSKRKQ